MCEWSSHHLFVFSCRHPDGHHLAFWFSLPYVTFFCFPFHTHLLVGSQAVGLPRVQGLCRKLPVGLAAEPSSCRSPEAEVC